jgi:hypothetical protein
VQETISMKIPRELKERLRALAAQRGVSVSALVKEGIRSALGDRVAGSAPTCHDLIAPYLVAPDRVGASGLGDLAADKRHLAGLGRRQPPAP